MSTRADYDHVAPSWRLPFGISRAYVLLIAIHGMAAFALGQVSAYSFDPGMAQILAFIMTMLLPWFLMVLLIRRVWILARVEKSNAPIQDLMASLSGLMRDRDRMIGGSLKLLLACFFVGASAHLKEMITVIYPFSRDEAFAKLEPGAALWP